MTTLSNAYQYDARGYYIGKIDDYGGPLPNNSTRVAPLEQEAHIPQWNGDAWEQVENHKGEQGYVDGEPYTMADYGPYPAGWSTDPPPLTLFERIQAVQNNYEGPLGVLRAAYISAMALEDTEDATAIKTEYSAMLAQMEAEIEAIQG